jgi:hypothetical protein
VSSGGGVMGGWGCAYGMDENTLSATTGTNETHVMFIGPCRDASLHAFNIRTGKMW